MRTRSARRPAAPAFPERAERTTAVTLYFQVHQPFRLRHFTFFDIGAAFEHAE